MSQKTTSDHLVSLGAHFVGNHLAHYSSKYYDPVKAREYYLKNRELKGKRSTRDLSKAGKEVWKVAKAEITTEKKAVLKEDTEDKKAEVIGLRKNATAKRKALSEKIKGILKDLSEDTKAQIEAVPKVPKGLSKEARAKAALKRKEEIAKIRGEAKSERLGTREQADTDRKKVASDLKSVVTKATEKYKELRTQVVAEYEAKYQAEYDAIKSGV